MTGLPSTNTWTSVASTPITNSAGCALNGAGTTLYVKVYSDQNLYYIDTNTGSALSVLNANSGSLRQALCVSPTTGAVTQLLCPSARPA